MPGMITFALLEIGENFGRLGTKRSKYVYKKVSDTEAVNLTTNKIEEVSKYMSLRDLKDREFTDGEL